MAKWTKTSAIFGVLLLMAGCQRLPDEPSPPEGDESEGSTGFPSAEVGSDSGLDSTGTGEGVDPSVCTPGLESSTWGGPSSLAGVEIFDGSLTLMNVTDEDLSWLQCLQQIRGSLHIVDSPALTDLQGLQRLQSVEGWLRLSNTAISDADGLSNLRTVERLILADNTELQQLDGLVGLQTTDQVQVTGHPLLTGLHLPLLTTTLFLQISDNAALQELDLTGITHVGHSLSVGMNPSVTDLSGLSNLEVVEGEVRIDFMNGLTTTAELSSLRRVDGFLRISGNTGLERIELPALEQGQVVIAADDPALTQIDLPVLVSLEVIRLRHLDALVEPPDLTMSSGLVGLDVEDVPLMTSLDWVGALPASAGWVELTNLPLLTDLAPLVGVTEMTGALWLTDLPALPSLDDLASLEAVYRDVILADMPQLTTLLPLSLTSISAHPNGAGLVIEGMDGLSSLEGLSSLTLGGSLRLSDNAALSSIGALSSSTVMGSVTVSNNDQLTDLSGLEGLQSTGFNFIIEGNDALVALTTLDSVSGIQILSIVDNDALVSLDGLGAAQSISHDMVIEGNDALVSLDGLEGVESVRLASIVGNDALVSLDGLSGIRFIEFELSITDNAVLSDFGGMWPTPVGMLETLGPLSIQSNPMLSQCLVDDFVTALVDAGWPGMPQVGDNLRCAR